MRTLTSYTQCFGVYPQQTLNIWHSFLKWTNAAIPGVTLLCDVCVFRVLM